MARTEGLHTGGSLLTRVLFFFVKRRLGHVPQPTRVMALRPPLLRAGAFMEASQEASTLIPLRLKKLAQTLVASRVGCPF